MSRVKSATDPELDSSIDDSCPSPAPRPVDPEQRMYDRASRASLLLVVVSTAGATAMLCALICVGAVRRVLR